MNARQIFAEQMTDAAADELLTALISEMAATLNHLGIGRVEQISIELRRMLEAREARIGFTKGKWIIE